ncbi:MAG: S8 family peptidase [Mycobacteriales bacterium]
MPSRIRMVCSAAVAVSLLLLGLSAPAGADSGTATGAEETYLVLYKLEAVPADAAGAVSAAGGTLVAAYAQIGVLVARSANPSFRAELMRDTRVEGAAATTNLASPLRTDFGTAEGPPEGDLPNAPAADSDSLSGLQWDMRQIHTPEAHAVTGGSPAVVVGDIDTGLDFTHPDLASNYSPADSADCSSGAPLPLAPGNDRNGHGTHTGGTIAAASNGIGIVGVAPNVHLAGIKSSNDAGFFFPEMVVCSFIWAGTRHLDVVNNSYFADPFLYNCRNDRVQRAIWKAEQRAIRYAMNQGVTVVASAGNDSDDLSHPGLDVTSPDFPPGSELQREVTNACVVIPVEISGVIGVSAVGHNEQADRDEGPDYLKSFYSSYGVSAVDVTAPGGDSLFGRNAEAPNGRVLSTYPPNVPCARSVQEPPSDPSLPTTTYCYLQGTSMAGPHATGVAALIISRFGDLQNPQNGKMRPGSVEALLLQTSDQQPCPETLPPGYEAFTQTSGEPQSCTGGPGQTSWYGKGQVNALRAVTHTPGS